MKSFFALVLAFTVSSAWAGEVDVTDVKMRKTGPNTYRFDVTLKHADTGWDHYADKWQVVGPDGTVLGTRVLAHPHVNEQPFTRSLGGVKIADGIDKVVIRGGDSVHGLGGVEITVAID
ncbi:MAG: hypothetical protein GKR97_07995 [Rhizobiaceae bacterium]|nr:hypothetical protein [Rhizobiaceae bacterium]